MAKEMKPATKLHTNLHLTKNHLEPTTHPQRRGIPNPDLPSLRFDYFLMANGVVSTQTKRVPNISVIRLNFLSTFVCSFALFRKSC